MKSENPFGLLFSFVSSDVPLLPLGFTVKVSEEFRAPRYPESA